MTARVRLLSSDYQRSVTGRGTPWKTCEGRAFTPVWGPRHNFLPHFPWTFPIVVFTVNSSEKSYQHQHPPPVAVTCTEHRQSTPVSFSQFVETIYPSSETFSGLCSFSLLHTFPYTIPLQSNAEAKSATAYFITKISLTM